MVYETEHDELPVIGESIRDLISQGRWHLYKTGGQEAPYAIVSFRCDCACGHVSDHVEKIYMIRMDGSVHATINEDQSARKTYWLRVLNA